MTEIDQQLLPLAEFLGIPLIILTPLVAILFVIFKYVLPKLLGNNSRMVGRIVISIVSQLFGENEADGIVSGVSELEASKTIKALPQRVDNSVSRVEDSVMRQEENLSSTIELIILLSEAMMAERYIKPQNEQILTTVKKKGQKLVEKMQQENEDYIKEKINRINEPVDKTADKINDKVEETSDVLKI